MRKVIGYIILGICILIYFVSSSQKLTFKLNLLKEQSNSFWGSDKHRYGDLFGLTYLSSFKRRSTGSFKLPDCSVQKKIDLYEICDSYMFLFFNSAKYYCGVEKLTQIKTNEQETLAAKLDTSKINVLLLEFSERNVRVLLEDSDYMKNIISENYSNNSKSKLKEKIKDAYHFLFNKDINTNLEYHICDYAVFTPIKEFKANLNYKLFNTIDKDVKLSKSGNQLFYAPTIDSSKISSSFQHVTDSEIKVIVASLNKIYLKAKKLGFNKIYLSIIPNPVSILEPDYNKLKYNYLITRIQNSQELLVPYVDAFSLLNAAKKDAYSPSDTHWTWHGAYIWLDKFNYDLANAIKEKIKTN
ncbi:MAG TPA: hypothetical protein VGI43_15375 [Mucilaginibacter sp.]|jgi:hypothetical protein